MGEPLHVFLSWSGEQSKALATVLKDWIALVVQSADPFHSDEDIPAGTWWNSQLRDAMTRSGFGILCLTPENRQSNWVHFEAGTLSAGLGEDRRVAGVCLGIDKLSITHPLAGLQLVDADRDGLLKLLRSLNDVAETQIAPPRLESTFDTFWPDLEHELEAIKEVVAIPPQQPTEAEMLTEIVSTMRSMDRVLRGLQPMDLQGAPAVDAVLARWSEGTPRSGIWKSVSDYTVDFQRQSQIETAKQIVEGMGYVGTGFTFVGPTLVIQLEASISEAEAKMLRSAMWVGRVKHVEFAGPREAP